MEGGREGGREVVVCVSLSDLPFCLPLSLLPPPLQVTYMSNLFPALARAAIGAASKTSNSQMQTRLTEQSKTLTESTLQVRGQVMSCFLQYIYIILYTVAAKKVNTSRATEGLVSSVLSPRNSKFFSFRFPFPFFHFSFFHFRAR